MSHINAIHGKRHIVVCITHHEAKIFIVISFAFFWRFVCVCMSPCVVCSRVWIFGCRPLFGLFTHNENRFNSFGLQVVVCVFLYLLLSHDVTDFCVQAFPTDEQIVVLVPDYFYCFFACSFNFFSPSTSIVYLMFCQGIKERFAEAQAYDTVVFLICIQIP